MERRVRHRETYGGHIRVTSGGGCSQGFPSGPVLEQRQWQEHLKAERIQHFRKAHRTNNHEAATDKPFPETDKLGRLHIFLRFCFFYHSRFTMFCQFLLYNKVTQS